MICGPCDRENESGGSPPRFAVLRAQYPPWRRGIRHSQWISEFANGGLSSRREFRGGEIPRLTSDLASRVRLSLVMRRPVRSGVRVATEAKEVKPGERSKGSKTKIFPAKPIPFVKRCLVFGASEDECGPFYDKCAVENTRAAEPSHPMRARIPSAAPPRFGDGSRPALLPPAPRINHHIHRLRRAGWAGAPEASRAQPHWVHLVAKARRTSCPIHDTRGDGPASFAPRRPRPLRNLASLIEPTRRRRARSPG